MRLSLWQSFSSNHSAAFTLVGVFKTPAEAEAAAERLRTLARAMREARQAARENREPDKSLTEPEKLMAWNLGIARGWGQMDWADIPIGSDPVATFENIVFIDGSESETGARSTEALLARLGSTTFVSGLFDPEGSKHETWAVTTVRLNCQALNEATAEAIVAEVEDYWRRSNANANLFFERHFQVATPWQEFEADPAHLEFSGRLSRKEMELVIEDGQFARLEMGLPALVAYLRAKGCTAIEFSFHEERSGV